MYGRYKMDVESIAAGDRANRDLAALMRQSHSCAFGRTQCSIGTDVVIRQRNVGITEEE